jgi:hypothetical protein
MGLEDNCLPRALQIYLNNRQENVWIRVNTRIRGCGDQLGKCVGWVRVLGNVSGAVKFACLP